MLAGRAIHADLALALHHLAVTADIDPARVRIAGEGDIARSDIVATVARPETRRGQGGHIDIVPGQDNLIHRGGPGVNHLWLDTAPAAFARGEDQIACREIGI